MSFFFVNVWLEWHHLCSTDTNDCFLSVTKWIVNMWIKYRFKKRFKMSFCALRIYRPTLWLFTTLCECNQDYSTDPPPQSCFRWNCIPTQTPRNEIIFPFHFINSQNESLSHPRTLSGMTFLLSLWLVVRCICLLTSWFIYWCLAWNHGWHGIPWCKWKQVNIPVSLPAAAALETWISAVNVTPASCWWERTNTLYTEY